VPSGQNPEEPPGGTPDENPPAAAPEINLVVNVPSATPAPTPASGGTNLTSSDWEALTELIEAKKDLQVAKRPFIDRLVLQGLLPLALIVVGPWATYYFANRAEDGLAEVKKANEESEKLAKVITDLEATLQGAEVKIGEMDRARAAELLKMEKMVRALDDTMKNALIQMTVSRILAERDRPEMLLPMMRPVGEPPQPDHVVEGPDFPPDPTGVSTIDQGDDVEQPPPDVSREAMEQLQVPGLSGDDLRGRVANAYHRIKTAKK
jgi:hypothetical protein